MTTWQLEVYVVDPARTGFRLDVTPLDSSARLLTPPPGTFRLNAGILDSDLLAPVIEPHIWLDLLGYATNVTARTSHRPDALVIPQEAGALSAPLIDPPDLSALGVQRGTPIRLVKNNRVLWWGFVDRAASTWDAETGHTTAQLTTFDAAGLWGSITRYGARSSGPETLRDRLSRLLASSPIPAVAPSWSTDEPIPLDGGGSLLVQSGQLPPTVMETNLLAHVTMAAASCGLAVSTRTPTDPSADLVVTLALIDPTAIAAPAATLHDAGAGIDYLTTAEFTTSDPITVAEVTTHGMTVDGEADDQTTTVSDPTAVTVFGPVADSLDITADPALAKPLAERWLSLSRLPEMAPTSVTIKGDADPGITCLDIIRVTRLGRTYTRRVAGVTHTVTPQPHSEPKHLVTLDLT